MTGSVEMNHFLIGLPAGFSTLAILWINQFPDFTADKAAGKKNLVVRMGLKASRYVYDFLMISVFLSTAILIFLRIYPVWTAIILLPLPLALSAMKTLSKEYASPQKLIPAQGITIQLQLLTSLLITAGIILRIWVS